MRGGPVNKVVRFSVLPVAALAVACGRGKSADKDAALTADLKRDLAAASASGVELASNVGDYQRTRFVSAIESPATSAPVRKRNVHKPVARPASAGEGQVAKSPEPAVENKVEVAQPEPSTETPAPAVEAPTVVAATPRPTPVGTAPATTDVGSGAVGGRSRRAPRTGRTAPGRSWDDRGPWSASARRPRRPALPAPAASRAAVRERGTC